MNGSEGSVVYFLERPLELLVGRRGGAGLERVAVPEAFLKHPASQRNAREGDPLATFRYDQDAEFIEAIRQGRGCSPSFADGARVQAVMDAVGVSEREGRWVGVENI